MHGSGVRLKGFSIRLIDTADQWALLFQLTLYATKMLGVVSDHNTKMEVSNFRLHSSGVVE